MVVVSPAGRLTCLADVIATFAAAGLALAFAIPLLDTALGLAAGFVWRAAALAGLTAGLIVWLCASSLAPAEFGPANRLTSVRALGVALIAAFVGETPGAQVAWFVVAWSILLLILDGVDGSVARRSRQTSAFGARFDMETDAALTLVLTVLCWQFDKAGAWILAAGLMRYVFVAAAFVAPWLGRPLPYSRRRQTICIAQLGGLLAVLSPLVPVPASSLVGVATVLLLAVSFAIDIEWLFRRRSAEPEVA